MQTARRLYIYLLSAISLGVLAAGLTLLLTVLFDALGLRAAGDVLFGDDTTREQLTLAAALTVVSLPVWLAHWIAAERSVDPRRPAAEFDAERSSIVRGLYFALAMGVLLLAAALSARALVEWLVLTATGGETFGLFGFPNPAGDLALFIVAGAAWLYHVLLRARDWRRGSIHGAGAFLPRTYLYLATFVGLLALLTGVIGVVELAGRVLIGEPTFGVDGEWWTQPLAGAIAGILIGGAVWIGHWIFSRRLLADPGWRGASERPAKVRLAFYLAVIVVTASGALSQLVSSASTAIRALLGVEQGLSGGQVAGQIVLPLIGALIFAIAWWLHRGWLVHEADAVGTRERVRTAGRLEEYGTALVGLSFLAGGIAALVALAIRALFARTEVIGGEDFVASDLAFGVPTALLGLAVWIWAWRQVTARYAETPVDEAASTSRRVALLLVVAVSLLSGIASLAFILYRLFGELLGVPSVIDMATELAGPIAALVVSVAVGLYHAALIRRDQALVRPAADVGPAVEVSVAPPVAADLPAPSAMVLRLSGPAGVDVAATADALRASLPEGFALETVSGPEPGGNS